MAMAPATPTAAGSSSSPHPDDPGRMLSQEAVMPDGMAAFSSGVHDRLDVVEIGAADAVDAPFAQVDAPRAVAMMFQSDDPFAADHLRAVDARSEEHTSELQSLMRISYAVFCLKKKK